MAGNRRHISPEIKRMVVSMTDYPDMTPGTIRRLTGASQCSKSRWRSMQAHTGDVVPILIANGRPRELDALDTAVSFSTALLVYAHTIRWFHIVPGRLR